MSSVRRAVVVLAVPVVLALGACAGSAGGGGGGEPAPATEIATWSQPAGIAPELVYVTDVEGFELNTQTVGVMGDDGMSAGYARDDGDAFTTVMLTTSRDAAPEDVPCADLPNSSEPEPVLRCGVERGDAYIALDGEGVGAATLRAAAEAVHVPTTDELERLFADLPVPEAPVERGDLPPEGDGAPLNDVGVGG